MLDFENLKTWNWASLVTQNSIWNLEEVGWWICKIYILALNHAHNTIKSDLARAWATSNTKRVSIGKIVCSWQVWLLVGLYLELNLLWSLAVWYFEVPLLCYRRILCFGLGKSRSCWAYWHQLSCCYRAVSIWVWKVWKFVSDRCRRWTDVSILNFLVWWLASRNCRGWWITWEVKRELSWVFWKTTSCCRLQEECGLPSKRWVNCQRPFRSVERVYIYLSSNLSICKYWEIMCWQLV